MLYPLTAAELGRVLLPIGEMTKDEVRARAAGLGLRTAQKPDSQDVCFITRSQGRESFLAARAELHEGRVVDASGATVGRVDAVELVTIGQRRGLELAGGSGRRFVTEVDVAERTVTVGVARDLLDTQLVLRDMVWADGPVEGEVTAQCSAHGRPAGATVTATVSGSVLEWTEPQRRVAPGQSVVLYQQVSTADGRMESVVVAGGIAV